MTATFLAFLLGVVVGTWNAVLGAAFKVIFESDDQKKVAKAKRAVRYFVICYLCVAAAGSIVLVAYWLFSNSPVSIMLKMVLLLCFSGSFTLSLTSIEGFRTSRIAAGCIVVSVILSWFLLVQLPSAEIASQYGTSSTTQPATTRPQ